MIPLEKGRGVWIAPVIVNQRHYARFLVDTGASVTLVGPALAERAGIRPDWRHAPLELHTPAGLTMGPSATASIRLGEGELRDAPVVIHDPGPGVDGILGNTVLGQYTITVDAEHSLLRLRPIESVGRR
jgi:predicted aspartyl protease